MTLSVDLTGFKVVRPLTIEPYSSPSLLTSTNVTEPNSPPDNAGKAFDQSPTSQTTNANTIEFTFTLTASDRVDSIYFENISAEEITIVVTDAIDGEVYNESFSTVSDSGITDWWAYFFEPIDRIADLLIEGLPPYAGAEIEVTLSDPGETVACGLCLLGLSRDIGGTKWSPRVGITDYSLKERSELGGPWDIVERAFAKRMSCQVLVANDRIDTVQTLLASYRATPILYVADSGYGALAVYGFFRSFEIEIAYPDVSLCTLEIEGLP